MALVSYSDSESDSETPTIKDQHATPSTQSTSSTSSKAGFQKVVNRAEPHKIKVSLSSLSQTHSANISEDDASERPAKRAKTGGAFSDFNSLLPAPKNLSKPANNSTQKTPEPKTNQGTPSENKISLKTGAEPAFRRDEVATDTRNDEGGSTSKVVKTEDVKIIGSNVMFRPLSVSRKPKKKAVVPKATTLSKPTPPDTQTSLAKQDPTPLEPTPKKVKKSLFSVPEEDSTIHTNGDPSDYRPMFAQDESIVEGSYTEGDPAEDIASTTGTAGGQSLEELASSMGLSASERRQLFGRSGKPTDAQVAQFSLAAEYAHNREMLEKQDTAPQHNPVKSIAPGKHSLQQLMKAASSNKDALEESFVRGKNNKKEAGSKYGW